MSRSRRPTRADVSRALAADVSGTEPATEDVRRLAALATAANRPAGATTPTTPWWRHGTVVGVLGVALATGVGASYATGLVDVPWSPSDHPVEHRPLLPELPSPSTERSPDAPA